MIEIAVAIFIITVSAIMAGICVYMLWDDYRFNKKTDKRHFK